MKTVQFSRYGGPEVLELVDAPKPEPGPGQVRVAVRAIGLNLLDVKIRRGLIPGRPIGGPLGIELAGVVDRVGEGVTRFSVGDEALGSMPATSAYAEYAVIDPGQLTHKPAGLAWEVAAGVHIAARTAWGVLADLGVGEGDVLLIHAAAGGVGIVAAQLARQRGATVIGTASEANHDFLRSIGVMPVAYGGGLRERIVDLAPDRIDAVLDASGRGELPLSIELAGGAERVVTIAAHDAAQYGVLFSREPLSDAAVAGAVDVVALVAKGEMQIPVWRTYPLEEVQAAHVAIENGHLRGKIILLP